MAGDQLDNPAEGGAPRCGGGCPRCGGRLVRGPSSLPVCRRGLVLAAGSSVVVGLFSLAAGMTAAERLTTIRALHGLIEFLQLREERMQHLPPPPPAEAPAPRAPGGAP